MSEKPRTMTGRDLAMGYGLDDEHHCESSGDSILEAMAEARDTYEDETGVEP